MVARCDARAIALGRGDREPHLDLASAELSRDVETRVAEDAEHGPVLGQNLRDELLDADLRCERREALEEPRADAPALEVVLDRERDLGGAPVTEARVIRKRHHSPLEPAAEGAPLLPVRLDEHLGELRGEVRETVEPLVAAAVREVGEELEQSVGVRGERRAQAQGRAVPEDDVGRVVGERAHASVPILPAEARGRIVAGAQSRRGLSAESPCVVPATAIRAIPDGAPERQCDGRHDRKE